MFEQPNNQVGVGAAGNQPKLGFMERVDQYYAEKNNWKKLNGGSPISTDINATLELLNANVHPTSPNLAEMVKASVLKYAAEGQTFEQIWSDKILEGANFVGIVDGVFGFYKGEEKLPTNNKPLQISAMPVVLELREKERSMVMNRAKLARGAMMADFQAKVEVVPAVVAPVVEESVASVVETPVAVETEFPELEITAGQL